MPLNLPQLPALKRPTSAFSSQRVIIHASIHSIPHPPFPPAHASLYHVIYPQSVSHSLTQSTPLKHQT